MICRFITFLLFMPGIVVGFETLDANAAWNRSSGAVIEAGVQKNAAYRIDIPADWNHAIVIFYHGYYVDKPGFDKQPLDKLKQSFVDRGFALLQSGYSDSGWVVDRADVETERLRQYFITRFGRPKETFVVGLSMGGTLVVKTLEQSPRLYDGGLSLCGALMSSDEFGNRGFALRAAFDYFFPNLLGPLVPVPKDFQPDEKNETKVALALTQNPKASADLVSFFHQSDRTALAAEISFSTYEIMDLQQKAGGNPFSNADLIYMGTSDDDALNDGVKRYRADTKAALYLARNYTPDGKLLKPLLALHTTNDPAVPGNTSFAYSLAVARQGNGEQFVQQYVKHEGHCSYTPEQVGSAFDELLEWTRHGKRPVAGALPQ
jgi:pimeloyl-ACP methyl ester carboxylesterase